MENDVERLANTFNDCIKIYRGNCLPINYQENISIPTRHPYNSDCGWEDKRYTWFRWTAWYTRASPPGGTGGRPPRFGIPGGCPPRNRIFFIFFCYSPFFYILNIFEIKCPQSEKKLEFGVSVFDTPEPVPPPPSQNFVTTSLLIHNIHYLIQTWGSREVYRMETMRYGPWVSNAIIGEDKIDSKKPKIKE